VADETAGDASHETLAEPAEAVVAEHDHRGPAVLCAQQRDRVALDDVLADREVRDGPERLLAHGLHLTTRLSEQRLPEVHADD
jgi:hypothetical protein